MAVEKFIPIMNEQAPGVEEDERLSAFSSPCEGSEPYALMVLGDSMSPEFIEGDVIIIYPNNVITSGSYVIAQHNDDYTFRQFIEQDGRYYLKALNEAYPLEEVPGVEVVKGVIVQKKGKGGGRKNIKHYV
ncbi:MAG: S24 family peptidase [Thiohalomonadaceae bacterium]